MKEKIENMEKRLKNQKEEIKRVETKILNALTEEMTIENLNKAAIILERETRKLYEIQANLELLYALERDN